MTNPLYTNERAEKIFQMYAEDARVRHENSTETYTGHGPMHGCEAIVMEEFENAYQKYTNPSKIPAGTKVIIDFCHDDGCYGHAFINGVIIRFSMEMKDAHKLFYDFEGEIFIIEMDEDHPLLHVMLEMSETMSNIIHLDEMPELANHRFTGETPNEA